MTRTTTTRLILLGLLLLAFTGCAKTYVVTQNLESPLPTRPGCTIGVIEDGLPVDMDADDKPNAEDMAKLSEYLEKYLLEEEVLIMLSPNQEGLTYTVRGTVLEFKRGSGFMRVFPILNWFASAKLTVNLELVEMSSGEIIFGGNFTEVVTSDLESGAKTYERVAQKFAKELRKQNKKLNEAVLSASAGV